MSGTLVDVDVALVEGHEALAGGDWAGPRDAFQAALSVTEGDTVGKLVVPTRDVVHGTMRTFHDAGSYRAHVTGRSALDLDIRTVSAEDSRRGELRLLPLTLVILVLAFGALVIILAEGGLTTRWADVRPSIGAGITLATVGVGVTTAVVAALGHYILGLDWQLAVLLGAVFAPTDAAAAAANGAGR